MKDNNCIDEGLIVALGKGVAIRTIDNQKGVPNGIASLDGNGTVVEPSKKQQIDAEAIIDDNGIIVASINDPTSISLINNVQYEIDIALPVASITGSLPYDTPMILYLGTIPIPITSVFNNSSSNILFGEMESVMQPYNNETGFRWIFDATYNEVTNGGNTIRTMNITPTISRNDNYIIVLSNSTMLDSITSGDVLFGRFMANQIATPSDDDGYAKGHLYQYTRIGDGTEESPYDYSWEDITAGGESVTVNTDSTSGAKVVAALNNSEYNFTNSSGISAITISNITTPSTIQSFNFSISFISGTTATVITNTLNAYFIGQDCSGGVFTPVASMTYQLSIWYNQIGWYGSAIRLA